MYQIIYKNEAEPYFNVSSFGWKFISGIIIINAAKVTG